ncbi:hypothetical protein Xen7305DRAFT_00024660 [Xenococcus sp. PCC 7305]|uniref:hypothetical protein n=1 Tax=Xenococcus sp. PCC 7305 TaxID=102125 RepID=UPI0002AC09ED|nr:hypothetical protein [Xenococcus sp. PCC 7305]ELS02748.1 hypothetical protein Xen7305DRAFT_00024660 [Xenococcus sp. PCC 7305]
MQDKQKVTLYIPPELHRKLKIRAAIDAESMSALVSKAVDFYLQNPEVVEHLDAKIQGRKHQVHVCPECDAAMVMQGGEMVSLKGQSVTILEDSPLEKVIQNNGRSQAQEELVTC